MCRVETRAVSFEFRIVAMEIVTIRVRRVDSHPTGHRAEHVRFSFPRFHLYPRCYGCARAESTSSECAQRNRCHSTTRKISRNVTRKRMRTTIAETISLSMTFTAYRGRIANVPPSQPAKPCNRRSFRRSYDARFVRAAAVVRQRIPNVDRSMHVVRTRWNTIPDYCCARPN